MSRSHGATRYYLITAADVCLFEMRASSVAHFSLRCQPWRVGVSRKPVSGRVAAVSSIPGQSSPSTNV